MSRGIVIIGIRSSTRLSRFEQRKHNRKPPPPLPDIPGWTDRDGIRQYYTTQLPTVVDTGRVDRGCGNATWYEWLVIGLFTLAAVIISLL